MVGKIIIKPPSPAKVVKIPIPTTYDCAMLHNKGIKDVEGIKCANQLPLK